MTRSTIVAMLVVAVIASAGCAASRASLSADADHLLGPVSLSSSVPGSRGEVLRRGPDLEVVGRFTRVKTYRSIAWGLLLPWRGWDATDELNEEIRKYNGAVAVAAVAIRLRRAALPRANFLAVPGGPALRYATTSRSLSRWRRR